MASSWRGWAAERGAGGAAGRRSAGARRGAEPELLLELPDSESESLELEDESVKTHFFNVVILRDWNVSTGTLACDAGII